MSDECKRFLVSVIIPVYNAEKYVREAVASALAQSETGEVLLIEDGSPDNALAVCRQLAADCDKIRIYRHRWGRNRGAGASRNLGIQKANYPFLAFLDADDFFLQDRFMTAKEIMMSDQTIDGVCEAVGTRFESAAARERYLGMGKEELTTMHRRVPPEELFFQMSPVGLGGFFQTNGWTIKKSAALSVGCFDEHLRLHQDTVFFVKLLAACRIMQGKIDCPVAMRRVHDHNRITAKRSLMQAYKTRRHALESLYAWCRTNTGERQREAALNLLLRDVAKPPLKNPSELVIRLVSFSLLFVCFFRNPHLVATTNYRKKLRSCFEEKPGQWMTLYEWGWLVKDALRRGRS